MDPLTIGLGLLKFAPMAAKWLGGDKAEEAAKDIVGIAEKVTGKKGEAAEKAIAADPKLAMEFKRQVLDHELQFDKIYLKDRQNARERDLDMRKLGYKNTRADVMIIIVGIALVVDIVLLWHNPNMPQGIVAIFNMMVGACLKMLGDAFAFEFGSSRGSKEKDMLR